MELPDGLLLSFYGDDFTGSTDGMEALAKAGIRTLLFLEPPAPEQLARYAGLRAVGVAGISRSLTPAAMDRELPPIFARMRALPAPLFHVKICSTFDSSPEHGSIGRTLEIGLSYFPAPLVPLLVGAPILNRFCVFGNLFARSGPESEVFRLDRHPTMACHPVTPMRESDLRLHLAAQTKHPIGLVDVVQVEAGFEAVRTQWDALQQSGYTVALLDILRDAHLPALGRLLWEQGHAQSPLFVIGSSAVEYALSAYWRSQEWLSDPPTFHADPVEQILVVSGSCSPVTARQISWAVANGFLEVALDPVPLVTVETRNRTMEKALQEIREGLRSGRNVVAHTCKGPEDSRLAQMREKGLESGKLLGRALGQLLRRALMESGLRRVVVTGGDTSGFVAQELGIVALETLRPMAPGSPLCRAEAPGSPLDGLEILFKGGQVGRVDLLGSILRGAI